MRACVVLAGLVAAPALGQVVPSVGVVVDVTDAELRPGESTTVTMSAAWGDRYFAMAAIWTDLISSEGAEGLSDPRLIAPMDGPGTSAGEAAATGIDGIIAGKLNFPVGGLPPDPNPIPFWRATYTAPFGASAPFDVVLATETDVFEVYTEFGSATTESLIDEVVEGSASIRVLPAPASLALLGVGVVAASRRRSRA
ncbi:MAG: hypothetical protein AAFX79_13120 [Planctomycetota bacterium]